MVKAIMDGTKTQTRRVIKSKNTEMTALLINLYAGVDVERCKEELMRCYALVQKDDVLWVRETFCEAGNFAGDFIDNSEVIAYKTEEAFFYLNGNKLDTEFWNWEKLKWKPSIFMPKKVCRNFLKCTNVRIEEVQDISEEDAKAEGVLIGDGFELYHNYLKDGYRWKNSAKDSFESLWYSINGKESWNNNPFVFVYDFEMTDKPENF